MSEISGRPATKGQIRSIHAAKAAHGLEDGEYRDMLEARFDRRSSKELTRRQASELLATFGRRLPNPPGRAPGPARGGSARKNAGGASTARPKSAGNVTALPTAAQRDLVRELEGRIEWREPDGARRWMKASFGWERPRSIEEAAEAIEGLKAMCRRAGRWAE